MVHRTKDESKVMQFLVCNQILIHRKVYSGSFYIYDPIENLHPHCMYIHIYMEESEGRWWEEGGGSW